MKASNIAPVVVVFILGVTAGIIGSQINSTSVQSTSSVDQPELLVTSPALIARFEEMEARLGELTAALNRVDDRIKGIGSPEDERQLSVNGPNSREKRAADSVSEPGVNAGKFEEIKSRVFDSLQDPATNFTALLHSKEMRSLSREQQDEVMQEVAARLDSGRLNKEQFLPGHKPKIGSN